MEIQKNMAMVIRAIKDASGKSMSEFSAELEISRSALQDYLAGKGNPCVDTINHIADKLGVDTAFLVSGEFNRNQVEVLIKLLDMMQFLTKYSRPQRLRIAEVLVDLLDLVC